MQELVAPAQRIEPSSTAYQCPSRGHRAKGAYGVANDRSASRGAATARKGSGAYEEDGLEVGTMLGASCYENQ